MLLKVSAAKLHATSGHISLIKKLIEPSPMSSSGERILCFPQKKKKKERKKKGLQFTQQWTQMKVVNSENRSAIYHIY